MEAIHKPEIRPWILPGKVNVREFIELWKNSQIQMELEINKQNLANKTQQYLGINQEMVECLEEDCSISALNCETDDEGIYTAYEKTIDIPASNLETLRLQREHLEMYKQDRSYRTAVLQAARYRNNPIRIEKSRESREEQSVMSDQIVTTPEVILTVQFYRPIRHETHYGLSHRYSFIADQELDVLGSQTLDKLRDAFICVSDISNPGDCSDNPKESVKVIASDIYKSGCFFINNTFYNDMRDECNLNYSDVIVRWAEDKGRQIGPLGTARMQDTRFVDLELQLGYPYLYMHQGDCEHVCVFSDIRIRLPNTDSMLSDDYPKIVSTNRRMQVRCGICNLNTSKWVTFGNKRLPEDPFFFCDACFHMFNYDEQGRKKSSFKAYPYLDKTALL